MTEQYPEFPQENRIDLHKGSEDLLPFKIVEARNEVGAAYAFKERAAPESYEVPTIEAPLELQTTPERDFAIGVGETIRYVRQHREE